MRPYLLLLLLSIASAPAHAQISGDAVLCPGTIVTYTATLPGAESYEWSYPQGWYEPQGLGTASLSVTCNVNIGDVCVTGMDGDGNVVGNACMSTMWGAGGGVDVQPAEVSGCISVDILLELVPVGGGVCPPCTGISHPNISYAVYTGYQFMNGQFVAFVDGNPFSFSGNGPLTVHLVDHTNGTAPGDAILISGGCAGGGNSTVMVTMWQPEPPFFMQDPPEACIGETILLWELQTSAWPQCPSCYWYGPQNMQLLSTPNASQVTVLVNGPNATVDFTGTSTHDCPVTGTAEITYCIGTGVSAATSGSWALREEAPHTYSILAPSGQIAQLRVMNMMGQMLEADNTPWVELSTRAPGQYILSAIDSAGDMMHWKVVR